MGVKAAVATSSRSFSAIVVAISSESAANLIPHPDVLQIHSEGTRRIRRGRHHAYVNMRLKTSISKVLILGYNIHFVSYSCLQALDVNISNKICLFLFFFNVKPFFDYVHLNQ